MCPFCLENKIENLELETQDLEIDIVPNENRAQSAGNGFGVKKRSFTLDFKSTLLEQLDQAKLVNPRGALSRIANQQNLSRQTLSKWANNPGLEELILTPQNAKIRKISKGRGIKNQAVDEFFSEFCKG